MNRGKVGIIASLCALFLLAQCDGGFGIYKTWPDASIPDLAAPPDLQALPPDLCTTPYIYAFEETLLSDKTNGHFVSCSGKSVTGELVRDTLTIKLNKLPGCPLSDGGIPDGGIPNEFCELNFDTSITPNEFDKMFTLSGMTKDTLQPGDTIEASLEAWTASMNVCGKKIDIPSSDPGLDPKPFSFQCSSRKGDEKEHRTDKVSFKISVQRNGCTQPYVWSATKLKLVASSFVPVVPSSHSP